MHPTTNPTHRSFASKRSRIAALGLTALATLGLSLGVASPALAHDELVDRSVVADAQTGSADAIRLSFNNSIIEVGTEIVVTSADGADVTDGTPEVSGPDVTQQLASDLPEGDYDIAWRVVSSDGHPIEGGFVLQLGAPGPTQAEDAAIVETDGSAEPVSGADESSADETAAEEASPAAGGAWTAILIGVGGVAVILAALALMARKRRALGTGSEGDAR
ncbi:copper resistance CopC family protein [Leucobacter tenebrionis]|uniref:copper resistance CopC family protein n=1 Tax=Leucobacter tenebrionis TaxID=2873270 RepID=UPI001CA612D6|nr:copper resistance CopC family protein [Leucobacter tenebrionis]QZY52555.1 copper resistance protein CopC [Leucobacter tenebrionis]